MPETTESRPKPMALYPESSQAVHPRSNPYILLLISVIGLLGGFLAGMSVEATTPLSRDVPPLIFGSMVGSIILFLGHLGYQLLLVLTSPEADEI